MLHRSLRAAMMAGTATLAMTVTAPANDFSRLVLFGDQMMDSGQYVDPDALFDGELTEGSDGRFRYTNRNADGGWGASLGDAITDKTGFGGTQPSNPQTHELVPEITPGTNYAAAYSGTGEVLASIEDVSATSDLLWLRGSERRQTLGNARPGFLVDPAREGWAVDALVVMNGGAQDVRETARVLRRIDGSTGAATYASDAAVMRDEMRAHADEMIDGAGQLSDAGAGVVVVANVFDQGRLPEVAFIRDGAIAGRAEMRARQDAGDVLNDDELAQLAVYEELAALTDAEIAQVRSDATSAFNAALVEGLEGRAGIVVIDQHALFERVIADPELFGFDPDIDQTLDCFQSKNEAPCAPSDASPDATVFADGQNPTVAMNAILAEQVAGAINAPLLVSKVPFVAIGAPRAAARAAEDQVTPERMARRGWAPFVALSGTGGQIKGQQGEPDVDWKSIGGVGGITYSLGNVAFGAAGGWQRIEDAGGLDVEGTALSGTAYAGLDAGRFFGTVSATYAQIDFDSVERTTPTGATSLRNDGETDATVYGLRAEAGWRAIVREDIEIGPLASVSHWSADVDGYEEGGDPLTAQVFDDFDGQSTRVAGGLFLKAGDLWGAARPVAFRGHVAYSQELQGDDVSVTGALVSNPGGTFTRTSDNGDGAGVEVGAQVLYRWGSVVGSIGYDGRFGDQVEHAGRIDVSLPLGGSAY